MKFEYATQPTRAQLKKDGHSPEQIRQILSAFGTNVVETDMVPAPATTKPVTPAVELDAVDMADTTLFVIASLLHDIEKTRKAAQNRLQFLTEHKQATDPKTNEPVLLTNGQPKMWGLGLDPEHITVVTARAIFQQLKGVEDSVTKQLEARMKRHPLGPWVKRHTGLGNKTVARLLAAIGDPAWNTATGEPRKLSELWQYAGHGSESKFQKGEQAFWNTEAKTRLFLISQGCMKTGKPGHRYRDIYDNRRAETAEKRHTVACPQCKHAQPGDPWRDGHKFADALRITGKEVLRDLWLEARAYHGMTS